MPNIPNKPHSRRRKRIVLRKLQLRRLNQEYRALTENPPDGIVAGPLKQEDMFYWQAFIEGPEGTPFEGGIFEAELKFPQDAMVVVSVRDCIDRAV